MLALLLCLAVFAACGDQKTVTPTKAAPESDDLPLQTVDVSAYQFTGDYPVLENTLTWEKINNLLQKHPGMTEDEMREYIRCRRRKA